MVDGVPGAFPNPAYGQLQGLGIALFVLAGHSRPDPMGQRLSSPKTSRCCQASSPALFSQACSAVMHFEKVCGGLVGRHRDPAALRHSAIPSGAHHHHVHRDDRGDDRIARMFPCAREITGKKSTATRLDEGFARRRRSAPARGLFNTFP